MLPRKYICVPKGQLAKTPFVGAELPVLVPFQVKVRTPPLVAPAAVSAVQALPIWASISPPNWVVTSTMFEPKMPVTATGLLPRLLGLVEVEMAVTIEPEEKVEANAHRWVRPETVNDQVPAAVAEVTVLPPPIGAPAIKDQVAPPLPLL